MTNHNVRKQLQQSKTCITTMDIITYLCIILLFIIIMFTKGC